MCLKRGERGQSSNIRVRSRPLTMMEGGFNGAGAERDGTERDAAAKRDAADAIARMALENFDEVGDTDASSDDAHDAHDDFVWTAEDPTPLRERFHSHDSLVCGSPSDDLPSGFLSAPQMDNTYILGSQARTSNGVWQEPTVTALPSSDDSKYGPKEGESFTPKCDRFGPNEGESFTPKCDRFFTDNICGTQGRLNDDGTMMVLDEDEHADHCDCAAWSCVLGGRFPGLEMRREGKVQVQVKVTKEISI